jgi:hypothetical protein
VAGAPGAVPADPSGLERRTVTVEAVGRRWQGVDLRPLLGTGGDPD